MKRKEKREKRISNIKGNYNGKRKCN